MSQTSKTHSTCHKLDATIILMFHETVIKCGDVVIIFVQNVGNTSRHSNENMGNKMKTQVPWTVVVECILKVWQ